MANSKDLRKEDGVVEEVLPGTMFRVRLSDNRLVLTHLKGKMRMYRIKIVPGDTVTVEFSPYDNEKGRIIRRL